MIRRVRNNLKRFWYRLNNEGSVGWLKTDTNKSKLAEPFQRAWLCRSCK